LRATCVGGHGLPVAARHAVIARIDAIRTCRAVRALHNHGLRPNPRGANHHEASDATLATNARAKIER
jgi:hypothetical protein